MASDTKRKRGRYLGIETFARIDPETGELTGEVIEADVLERQYTRNGFVIAYLSTILTMIDTLGNQKMKVVKYILENMDMYNNQLVATADEIAENAGVSKGTVINTLKGLEEANIIKRRTAHIYVSPKLLNRGNQQKERYMMLKFAQMSAKEEKQQLKEEKKIYLASNNFDKQPTKRENITNTKISVKK